MSSQTNIQPARSLELEVANTRRANAWALASQAIAWIEEFIRLQQIQSVIELGSGQPTILLRNVDHLNDYHRLSSLFCYFCEIEIVQVTLGCFLVWNWQDIKGVHPVHQLM